MTNADCAATKKFGYRKCVKCLHSSKQENTTRQKTKQTNKKLQSFKKNGGK